MDTMRRLLELTGRQGTLDEFRLARAKYGEAKSLHRDARQHFEQKKLSLAQLQTKLRQYREWEDIKAKLADIVELLLPAARHFESAEDLDDVKRTASAKQEEAVRLERDVETERQARDDKKTWIGGLATEYDKMAKLEKSLRTRVERATRLLGQVDERARQSWREFDAAWLAAGRTSLEEATTAVDSAELALSACISNRHEADMEIAKLQKDFQRIRAGGSMAPPATALNFRVFAAIAGDLTA